MKGTFNMHQQGSTTGADKLEFSPFHSNELWEPGALYKENKERGSCGNGRLLIHLYYSAVTGNRKQVLTGSSESCEHKCR